MKKLIFVLWSLLLTWELTSCPNIVTISNANPIQFWPASECTFNETEVCSIEPVFWCQPFECEDNIHIQYRDSSSYDAAVKVFNGHHELVTTVPMSRIATVGGDTVYDLDFTAEELNICDSVTMPIPILWDDEIACGGIIAFEKSSSEFFGAATGAFQTFGAAVDLSAFIPIGTTVSFPLTIRTTGAFNAGIFFVTIRFWDGDPCAGGNPCDNAYSHSALTSPNIYYDTVSFTMTNFPGRWLEVRCGMPSTPSDGSIEIVVGDAQDGQDVTFEIWDITSNTKLAKSDCVCIKTKQDCSELITYSNSNSFDDIDYADTSPSREFKLRIPAIFFEEDWPEEYESIDLSDSDMVQLSSEVKHKKLLDIGFIPFYMAEKIKLVLAHDNVIIQGMNWIKGDGMTKIPGNKRYPLRKWQALLTDKDFIKRNVL